MRKSESRTVPCVPAAFIGALAVLAGCVSSPEPAAPDLLTPHLAPAPQQASYEVQRRVDVNRTSLTIRCDDTDAADWVRRRLEEWLPGYAKPIVLSEPRGNALEHGEEAYRLKIAPTGVMVTANTIRGVRYALYSYRQAWEASRGGLKTTGFTAPCAEIDDWPRLGFRGIHLTWNLMTEGATVKFLEHELRMAAYLKLNYAVIENWGTFPSERYPDIGWDAGRKIPKSEIRRLAALAKELGVTVIPQLNVFGHAAMARWVSGKHATLDIRREYEPLFEPYGGWNWCLSNPAVLELQKTLIDEMCEAWGRPPYFHIGCDEAEPPSCSRCADGHYRERVARHIGAIAAHLKAKGVRPMMWHDMLLRKGDERFRGFYCKGAADAEALLGSLPRDIVICDWFYGGSWGRPAVSESYPTLDYFKAQGFDVVTCPWDTPDAIHAQTQWVLDHGMLGVLQTTWNHLTANDYANIWANGPNAAWGAPDRRGRGPDHQHVVSLWRQIGWDMGLTAADYDEFGFTINQNDRFMDKKY